VVGEVNVALHNTLHCVLANQLWANDPPEVRQAAQRLLAAVYSRAEALSELMVPLTTYIWVGLQRNALDHTGYAAALHRLPRD